MFNLLIAIQNAAMVLVILLVFYVMRQRPSHVQKDLILMNMALLIAIMSYTLEMKATSYEAAVTALKLSYVGRPIIILAMFFMLIDIMDIKIKPIFRTIFAAIQASFILIVFFFEKHGLYYTSVKFVQDGLFPHLVKTHGPLYYSFMIISFAFSVGMISLCIVKSKQVEDVEDRKMMTLLGLCVFFPIFGYAIHLSGITKGYNTTNLGYAIGSFLLMRVFSKYKVFEAVNVAWENVFQFISAGLLVYDKEGNLIYQNDMAKEINITDRADELFESREYVFCNDKVYRVEKLTITDNGNTYGYAYYLDNETDNYNYEARLREEKKRADDASIAKTQFLSSMSHDIRTPMNAILGLTDIARLHIEDKNRVEDCLNKIKISGRHLIELINAVLDINKIESGKFELMKEDFDIIGLTDEIAVMSKPLIEARSHTLSIDTSRVVHSWVNGDKNRLSQILMNLVSNSVKYTNNGGLIILNISETQSENGTGVYKIIVRDNGIGMSEEYIPTLFEPFTRAQDEKVYKSQGTGLGMSITKQFVELMGGTIEVRSTLDVGTTFEIVVPIEIADEKTRKTTATSIQDLAKTDFSGKRILVVEDNAVNAEIMGEFLKMSGISVEYAKDGKEAVSAITSAEDGKYDLIFMDVKMPRMNGYEATREIRSMNRTYAKEVPIIAVTANAFSEDVKDAIDSGMTSHIIKPIEYHKLYEVLIKYCS